MSEDQERAVRFIRLRESGYENLDARQRAADPVQRDRIDPSTGRTWRDAVGRGMYDDSRIQSFRDANAMHRQARQQQSRARMRARGWQGAN